jgi:hypothetical protein
MGKQSYRALVLIVLLAMTMGVTLVHWHNDWTSQGCELCHVRHLPVLISPEISGPANLFETDADWSKKDIEYVTPPIADKSLSRAPPRSFKQSA